MKSPIIRSLSTISPLILILLTFSCSSLRPLTADYSRICLENVDFNQAFHAARVVMHSKFSQITFDRESATIQSKPKYFVADNHTLFNQQFRRIARLRLINHQEKWWAYLQIRTDRRDTQTFRQFKKQRNGRDYDIASPMETNESAPWAKRQAWVPLNRLQDQEHEVLNLIRKALGLPISSSTPPSSSDHH